MFLRPLEILLRVLMRNPGTHIRNYFKGNPQY